MSLARRCAPLFVLVGLAVLTLTGATFAQGGFGGFGGGYFREGSFPTVPVPAMKSDADFVICRLAYRQIRREYSGIGWRTDYPYAEINLTTRFAELTKVRVSRDDESGEPRHYVTEPGSPSIFSCPMIVASDAGTLGFTPEEAVNLRSYLLKGGFIWFDDFWGDAAWSSFSREMAKVMPPDRYPLEQIAMDDPLLHSQFDLTHIPQITNIMFWRDSGGRETSERGAETRTPYLHVIRDAAGRIVVVATHNTDVADSWEREGEDPEFFMQFSPDGYALGVDVLLHAMTH